MQVHITLSQGRHSTRILRELWKKQEEEPNLVAAIPVSDYFWKVKQVRNLLEMGIIIKYGNSVFLSSYGETRILYQDNLGWNLEISLDYEDEYDPMGIS